MAETILASIAFSGVSLTLGDADKIALRVWFDAARKIDESFKRWGFESYFEPREDEDCKAY